MPSSSRAPDQGETRFGWGAWLTLALAALALVFPAAAALLGASVPSDGWSHTTSGSSSRYQFEVNLTDQPSRLHEGDILIAINGRPVIYGHRTPLPDDLRVGQTLRYTVSRDGETLDVDVLVVDRPAASLARYVAHRLQHDAFLPLLPLLIAAFTFSRRPGNQAARLMLLIFSFFAGANWFGLVNWDPFVYAYPGLGAFLILIYLAGWTWFFFPALAHLTLVFPTRLAPARRFPRLLPAILYGLPFLLSLGVVLATLAGSEAAAAVDTITVVSMVIVFIVTLCVGIIHNFRTTHDPVTRAQLRWIALGLGVGWGGGIGLLFLAFALPPLAAVADALFPWLILLFPLSLAIAITRYRLFEIDIIINRALVYGSLTGALLVTYLSGVALLQTTFRALTSQSSDLATILSTLGIAALFQPLRHWLQGAVDRAFYRRKYDASRTLSAFSAHLRDEVDLPVLQQELVAVARETMQPAFVSLWVRPSYMAPERDRQPNNE